MAPFRSSTSFLRLSSFLISVAAFFYVATVVWVGVSHAEEEFQVTAVEVEGNKVVSTATVLAKIKTRPGDRASQQTVDEDIKRLYGTGFFTDVSADLRPYKEGKLVRFLVKERPLVTTVVVTGARRFREAKLESR